jgi:hypothetical protein
MFVSCQVRVHRVSRSSGSPRGSYLEQTALFRCHTKRVKKLAVRFFLLALTTVFERSADLYYLDFCYILFLHMWDGSLYILVCGSL